jgi:hypothetical protein
MHDENHFHVDEFVQYGDIFALPPHRYATLGLVTLDIVACRRKGQENEPIYHSSVAKALHQLSGLRLYTPCPYVVTARGHYMLWSLL